MGKLPSPCCQNPVSGIFLIDPPPFPSDLICLKQKGTENRILVHKTMFSQNSEVFKASILTSQAPEEIEIEVSDPTTLSWLGQKLYCQKSHGDLKIEKYSIELVNEVVKLLSYWGLETTLNNFLSSLRSKIIPNDWPSTSNSFGGKLYQRYSIFSVYLESSTEKDRMTTYYTNKLLNPTTDQLKNLIHYLWVNHKFYHPGSSTFTFRSGKMTMLEVIKTILITCYCLKAPMVITVLTENQEIDCHSRNNWLTYLRKVEKELDRNTRIIRTPEELNLFTKTILAMCPF